MSRLFLFLCFFFYSLCFIFLFFFFFQAEDGIRDKLVTGVQTCALPIFLSPNDCRVATINDKVVGTVATIRYQNFFSWIGMVLVDPACQKQGIGMQLLKEALQILHNEETIKLDATPAGREVYLKLNFVDEYSLSRMSTISARGRLKSTARSLRKNDLPAVVKFDREIFGADRQPLLEWIFERAPQYAFLIEEKNEIQGYCLGRYGYNFTQIGPVIAR